MSYRRFNLAELGSAPATVATVATLLPPEPATVADVASVARLEAETALIASDLSKLAIRVRLRWISQRLQADHGRSRERANADALALIRSELANDPRLVPEQVNTRVCLVCGLPNQPGHVLVPVLTPTPDRHLWLHHGQCHQAHLDGQAELVGGFLRAALNPGEQHEAHSPQATARQHG